MIICTHSSFTNHTTYQRIHIYVYSVPEEMCGGFWQFLMGCCCGRFGGTYVQCCGMCGVAQETRELNRLFHPHQRAVDYLTMQPVLEYYSDILAHRHNEKSTIFQHNRAISSLSFQILVAFGLAFAATFFFCLVFMVWMPQFLMIVAVFTVATLFVYGIHIRFGVMNLCTDAVIKAFAAGFCIASSMSMPLIGIIGLILHGAMYVLLNTIGNGSHGGYGWYYSDDDSFDTEVYVTPFVTLISDVNDEFSRQMPTTHLVLLFFQCFFVAAFVQELTKYLAFRMASLHPDFWSKKDLDKVLDATDEEGEGGALVDLDILPEIPLGAQSRTFSARCYTILVASISVSVGVGCFDDLLYAAMYHNRGFHWGSLLFRIFLLSIHPVCAAWQALGISQFDVALDQEVQTGFIIFPAVISHGLFDFSILLGEYLIAEGLVGKNDVVQGLTRYLLPVIVLVASLVLVIFRFDVQQIKMRRKDKEGNYDYEGQPLGNTWSWELLPSEVVEPEVPEKTVERVPLSQRRKVVRIRAARGPSEMELPATIIDENIYNQFGIRTVSTADMSVEEVIKKFGVLESSPSYTPPVVAQSKSGTSANGLPRSESPSLAAAAATRQPLIAAPKQQHAVAQHPQVQIDNTPPPAIFQVPITESGGSRAYGEAMAILGNRAKAPNVPFPKAMPHMNTAASSSDNRLSTAMVSLNTPIDKRNMYAADACAAKETVSQQTEADKPPGAP